MSRISPIITIAMACILTLGCRKDTHVDNGDVLAFEATRITTKGFGDNLTDNTDLDTDGSAFGIYGCYAPSAGGTNSTNVFDGENAVKVTYYASDSEWSYYKDDESKKKYWKRNEHYRFRAFYPYDAAVLESASSVDEIIINYKIEEHDSDLLVAFATRCPAQDPEGFSRVKLTFKHALAALDFKVIFAENVPSGLKDEITEFWMVGLYPAENLTYSHAGDRLTPTLLWSASYFDDKNSYYQWTGNKEFGRKGDPGVEAVSVFDGDGLAFVIPQECSSSKGKTRIYFRTKDGGSTLHSAELENIIWEPGKIYTYTLHVNRSNINVTVSIKDWEVLQSNVDIYL